MSLPILGTIIDERFLEHRRRSSSLAGIVGAFVAIGLWAYRFYGQGVWDWYLFAVAVTIAGVKLAMMAWYRTTD